MPVIRLLALLPAARQPGPYTLTRELAFRGNFLVKVSVEVLWLAILLAFYRTVFARTSSIAGWYEPQYFFFVGCFFAMNGLIEMLFLDNCNEFAELVRTGDLDWLLLKPIDEQFLITCRRIDWGTAPNVLMGAAVMGDRPRQDGLAVRAAPRRDVPGHVRLRHGDRVQLHADPDVALGLDGAEPELDGDVVAVFEPGALSQGDLRRRVGRADRDILHVLRADPDRGERAGERHGPRPRPADGRADSGGDGALALAEPPILQARTKVISQREQLIRRRRADPDGRSWSA